MGDDNALFLEDGWHVRSLNSKKNVRKLNTGSCSAVAMS